MDFVKEIVGDDYYFHHSLTEKPGANLFNLHTHDAFEIFLLIRGDASINIEGKLYKLDKLDLCFIYPGQFHRVIPDTDSPYERKVIRFDYSFTRSVDPEDFLLSSLSDFGIIKGRDLRLTPVLEIYKRIERIFDYEGQIQRIYLNGAVSELLINISEILKTKDLINPQRSPDNKISDIIGYINENLTGDLSLDIISKNFFISKFHLSRLFKETTGSTIGNFIIKKRLLLAKRLIYGGCTAMTACYQSGFTDYSSFYKSYKKYFKAPPSKAAK